MIKSAPMRRSDFDYHLPDELIAQQPLAQRSASRLLHVTKANGALNDKSITDLPSFLQPHDLLVFNNTKVINARLHGQKMTGGKIEVLVERVLNEQEVHAHIRSSKSPKAGAKLILAGCVECEMLGREGALFHLRFNDNVLDILEQHGHVPLPPYIERDDEKSDVERYQTVYASEPGAVAAPTAGLHFDDDLLAACKQAGANFAYVTLHVGAGTFQPVKADEITDHEMHSEYLVVPPETCDAIAQARANGGRVIAIGTTSVRSLETAAMHSANPAEKIEPFSGDTQIFCYPGFEFKAIDALLTNFHLPESTLLMLVSALAGHKEIMAAYEHAVEQRYRFFSYGDAMLII